MVVYTSVDGRTLHASHYYRQLLPLEAMSRHTAGFKAAIDYSDISTPHLVRLQAMSYSDVNLFYQPMGQGLLDFMRTQRKWKPKLTPSGATKYPPVWIMDTDDNLLSVPPTNFTFKKMGVKRPDGTPLKVGDVIRWSNPTTGVEEVMWGDQGVEGVPFDKVMDIKGNLERMEVFKNLMREAHAVTCSNTRTEEYVRNEIGQTRTFIMPNCVFEQDYPEYELRDHPNEVRVLWQGSPTHYDDFYFMVEAIHEASRRFPHVKWVFWGAAYDKVLEGLDPERYELRRWVHYMAYKPLLAGLNHDINIALLRNDVFNRCRSEIKWLESSILPNPAATLAQDGDVYGSVVKDGETGFLFKDKDEFLEKFGILVESASKRRELADNAKTWALENRDIMKWAPRLREFYESVINERNSALGSVKAKAPKLIPLAEARRRMEKKKRATRKQHEPRRRQAAGRAKRGRG